MDTVLIITNFSQASKHALDYACTLLKDKTVRLQLLHIASVPFTYSLDGLAIAAVQHEFIRAEEQLNDEVVRARAACPDKDVSGTLVTGTFMDTLRDNVRAVRPLFVILGTKGFSDMPVGAENVLTALNSLTAPVFIVPADAAILPLKRLAYACNYSTLGPWIPVNQIVRKVQYLRADLEVLHVDTAAEGSSEKQDQGRKWLQAQLAQLPVVYHWVWDHDIIRGVTEAILTKNIDAIMIVPHRHSFWQHVLFHSRTIALLRRNNMPILLFPEIR